MDRTLALLHLIKWKVKFNSVELTLFDLRVFSVVRSSSLALNVELCARLVIACSRARRLNCNKLESAHLLVEAPRPFYIIPEIHNRLLIWLNLDISAN